MCLILDWNAYNHKWTTFMRWSLCWFHQFISNRRSTLTIMVTVVPSVYGVSTVVKFSTYPCQPFMTGRWGSDPVWINCHPFNPDPPHSAQSADSCKQTIDQPRNGMEEESRVYVLLYFVASELKDPICHSDECQIGSFSSEATICTWNFALRVVMHCFYLLAPPESVIRAVSIIT